MEPIEKEGSSREALLRLVPTNSGWDSHSHICLQALLLKENIQRPITGSWKLPFPETSSPGHSYLQVTGTQLKLLHAERESIILGN